MSLLHRLARTPFRVPFGMIAVWYFLLASSPLFGQQSELDQVREKFAEGQVLYAGMVHEFLDSYTGESQVTEGEIWLSKEKYKVRAEQQVVVVDGMISRVYNERQNKLVISEYEPEEDDFAPSRFFSESEEIYQVSDVARDGETISFTLTSDDPFEIFIEVVIILDRNLMPLEIRAIDQMDNEIKTTFMNAEYIEDPGTVFVLEYPDDAEIIDLRK